MARQSPTVISGRSYGRHDPSGRPGFGIASLFSFAALGFIIILIGIFAGSSSKNLMIEGTIAGFLILAPLIWNRPALGAYMLIGGAVVFEAFVLGFPDSITDQSLFFKSLSSVGGPGFVIINASEALMGIVLASVIARRIARGEKPLVFGPLFGAAGFYGIMVVYGLVFGVGTGSDIRIALWEFRSQAYLIVVYLVVVNVITETRQVKRMMWVLLGGIALKGLIGSWRFLVTLSGDLDMLQELARGGNSILSHEESYFFALFFLFALSLYLYKSHRGQLLFVVATSLPVLMALMVNQRRAGILVLIMGIVLTSFLAHRLISDRRKAIAIVTVILVLIFPIYLAVTWNSQGIVAEPTRAVRSLISPNDRDASSNEYREIESLDIKYNIQINPLTGRGFGHPIIFFIPLPDITEGFYFWDIIPHNTILWVWMRLGFVGFIAFWFLVGRSIVGSVLNAKNISNRYLKSVSLFTAIVLVTWIFMGAVDMGIVDPRETILVGGLMGLISAIPKIERKEIQEDKGLVEKSS